MKEQKKPKKGKKEFNRALINDLLPYELLVFYKLRQYALMQATGKLDIVNLIMFIEDKSEEEVYEECIQLLKLSNARHAKVVEFVRDTTTRDVDLNIYHFRKN